MKPTELTRGAGVQRRLQFQARVLIPVVVIMVLLLVVTMWLVNVRFENLMHRGARQRLVAGTDIFRYSQQIHQRYLLARYSGRSHEPRTKSLAISIPDPKTSEGVLQSYLEELGGTFAAFFDAPDEMRAFHCPDQSVVASIGANERRHLGDDVEALVDKAFHGEPLVDILELQQKLYHIVVTPIVVSDAVKGVLLFGEESSGRVAREFKQLSQCEIVMIANGRVLTSTFTQPASYPFLLELHRELSGSSIRTLATGRPILLRGEHFLANTGVIPWASGGELGYLLLSSYEEPLQQLRQIQSRLLLSALAAILLSTAIIWFLVRRITQPLRELRDGAEAVGRGDFSRRVNVQSNDECGDLAASFNRMVGNLETSRSELEETVERLRTTRAQLVQSEKLSAIGEFVAGVTHELNNPLTAVVGFAELARQSNRDEQQRLFLDNIMDGAKRCHKIVQSLLSFARQHPPERRLVHLNELIETALGFLQYELRTSNIEVRKRFDPALPQVMGDPHQLQQVFLNVINNARQAMDEHASGGSLTISSERGGSKVRLAFTDSGPGISASNMARIFQPFFTTKEVGKGTGLGLSLSYGIVQEHDGTLTVDSRAGEGASFIIELPVPDGIGSPVHAVPRAAATVPALEEGAGKRVLVIDDERPILELVAQTLLRAGYALDTACNGEDALRLAASTEYSIILCDWKMPGLNGQQIYERLHSRDPRAASRMIFMTGDVIREKTQQFVRDRGIPILAKPFSLDELRAAARNLASERNV